VSVYTDTIRERVLTSAALEDVQRAAQLLRTAAPAVKEAIDLLAPIAQAMDVKVLELLEAGHDVPDEENETLRSDTPYGEAIDLTCEILNEVQRVIG
jgi:hypothetical protein